MKHTTTTTSAPTIVSIDNSDRDSTDVVDIIHLSDGREIAVWNGNASYCVYDKLEGRVEVGATLVSVDDGTSYRGEDYQVYTFA